MTSTEPTGRWLAWVLAPAMLLWVGWRATVAVDELSGDYTVQGLFRTYTQPYEGVDGWVADPRPGPLAAEVWTRFELGEPPSPPPTDRAAWARALAAAGVQTRPVEDHWDGLNPRLHFGPKGAWLLVGAFGRQGVVFDPERGVVLLHAALPPGPGLELVGRREAAW